MKQDKRPRVDARTPQQPGKQTLRGDFARSLRIARRAARLTQRQLAARVGVDHSFISLLEAGARDIDLVGHATVVRIARELNQPTDDLFPVTTWEKGTPV